VGAVCLFCVVLAPEAGVLACERSSLAVSLAASALGTAEPALFLVASKESSEPERRGGGFLRYLGEMVASRKLSRALVGLRLLLLWCC
jgi:hypothetical protein